MAYKDVPFINASTMTFHIINSYQTKAMFIRQAKYNTYASIGVPHFKSFYLDMRL